MHVSFVENWSGVMKKVKVFLRRALELALDQERELSSNSNSGTGSAAAAPVLKIIVIPALNEVKKKKKWWSKIK